MRNGLTKTLAAIAIACLGYQAYAVAPVVNEIPTVYVTDGDTSPAVVTAPNTFVYQDFINLNDYVSDDGLLSNIIWSYYGDQGNGASDYRLNGADPLTTTTASTLIHPPAASQINLASNLAKFNGVAMGEYNPDNNVLTPTIRDIVQSPLGADYSTYTDTSADAAGNIYRSETITLYASDGTTASAGRDLTVFTQKTGTGFEDRLEATPAPTPVSVYSQTFATSTNNWTQGVAVGSVTFGSTGGLCITAATGGGIVGEWVSPYQIIPLVPNSVWRVRATMSTNQTTPGLVPLWDFVFDNYDTTVTPARGGQAYQGDYFFLDNTGSANAVKGPTAGRNVFDMWYTPMAVLTPQWNDPTTGGVAAANDNDNDLRIHFRVLCGGADYGGTLDNGQICLTDLQIDRFDLSRMYMVGSPDVYNLNPIVSGINGVSVDSVLYDAGVTDGTGDTADFSTAPLTVMPLDPNGWMNEVTFVTPGDTNNPSLGSGTYGDGSATFDNYPVQWDSNTLYQFVLTASAPDAASESSPPDGFLFGFDAHTNELLADSYQLSGLAGHPGMPKVGSPQSYTFFAWSHSATLDTTPGADRLRWKIEILNTTAYGPGTYNTGGLRFHGIKVRKVQFYGM